MGAASEGNGARDMGLEGFMEAVEGLGDGQGLREGTGDRSGGCGRESPRV